MTESESPTGIFLAGEQDSFGEGVGLSERWARQHIPRTGWRGKKGLRNHAYLRGW